MSFLFAYPGSPVGLAIGVAVIVVLFGNRVPGALRSVARGIIEFKRGLRGGNEPFDAPGDGSQKGEN